MSATTTTFGVNAAGGRNVGLTAYGARVLIQSDGPQHDASALTLAEAIVDAGSVLARKDAEVARLESEVDSLRVALAKATLQRDERQRAIDVATRGTRRFNGPVLCQPARAGEWSGAIWLLDPTKGSAGFGLRFASLAELRAAHPELWIVNVFADGILMDASPLATLVAS